MEKYAKGRYAARGFWWVGASARARGKVGAVSEEAKIGVFRIRRVWVSWFSGVFFGEALRVSLVYMSS